MSRPQTNPYEIELEAFTGPLDLLLHLIEKEQVDIWEISLTRITEQYLHHIRAMQELDLTVAGDFLLMAATLLSIKAKQLLPENPPDEEDVEGEDPRTELVTRLVEYQRFKQAAHELEVLFRDRSQQFARPVDEVSTGPPIFTNPVGSATIRTLLQAWQKIMSEQAVEPRDPKSLLRKQVSVHKQVILIHDRLKRERRLSFASFLEEVPTRDGMVASFLAILELVRRYHVQLYQEAPFLDIILVAPDA